MLLTIANFVSQSLPAQVSIVSMVLEFVLRLVPSEKPLSIAHLIAVGMHQVGQIVSGVADFLDKVLPQNISK